jgi:hypothetical protein
MIYIVTPDEEYEFSDLTEAVAWAEPHELIVSVRLAVNKWGKTIWVCRADDFLTAWIEKRRQELADDFWSCDRDRQNEYGRNIYGVEHFIDHELNPPIFVSKPKTIQRGFGVAQTLTEAAE